MAYAIVRTAKLSSMGSISGSSSHNFRERETKNADPERTPENETEGAQNSKEVLEKVKERLDTVPTVRKNAVLAIEYFMGASPEFFKTQDTKQQEAYFDKCEAWLKAKHGEANVVAITRQYDETSPHICAYVVPIDPNGKLNARHFLGGREKLTDLQTDFAEKCGKAVGLERGIQGSQAKHTTIKHFYADLKRVEDLPRLKNPNSVGLPPTKLLEGKEDYAKRAVKAYIDAIVPEMSILRRQAALNGTNAQKALESEKRAIHSQKQFEEQNKGLRTMLDKSTEEAVKHFLSVKTKHDEKRKAQEDFEKKYNNLSQQKKPQRQKI
jgi:hypothetical protein